MNQIKRFWAIEDKGEEAKAGWFAWYVLPYSPYVVSHPLIGWALVTRDSEDTIVGIVADMNSVIEADRPNGNDRFVMYMQRGGWTQEQIDKLDKDLRDMGKKLEAQHAEEARRSAATMGEGRVLPTAREDGTTTQRERAIRTLQGEIERGGSRISSDTPLQSPDDVEE